MSSFYTNQDGAHIYLSQSKNQPQRKNTTNPYPPLFKNLPQQQHTQLYQDLVPGPPSPHNGLYDSSLSAQNRRFAYERPQHRRNSSAGSDSGLQLTTASAYVENGYRCEGSVPVHVLDSSVNGNALPPRVIESSLNSNALLLRGQKPHQHLPSHEYQDRSHPLGGLFAAPQSYLMHNELGSGGAGHAFLATGKSDGKKYVVKQIMCLGDKYRPASASYALHETRLLFLLQHPHIVHLRDFYPHASNYFIVMEYCENGDLGNYMEEAAKKGVTKFESERLYTWWYQALDAIEFCHSNGVIHRDLKPKNIFLDASLNVKIGDFGVSALTEWPGAMERVGTPTYHAPEVVLSLVYTTKSDIWSIGCIMYEAMVLVPHGTLVVSLQTINLAHIPMEYGQFAREMLSLHLQPDMQHRPEASVLKESMQQLLKSIREKVVKDSQQVTKDTASHLYGVVMQIPPSVPAGSESSTLEHTAHAVALQSNGAHTSPDVGHRQQGPSSGSQVQPSSSGSQVQEAGDVIAAETGLRLAAGEGGEFGAWKIMGVKAGTPAAQADLMVGEYLWEIDGKVIFGMPYALISSIVGQHKTDGAHRLGLKKGLGLPIRHVTLPRPTPVVTMADPASVDGQVQLYDDGQQRTDAESGQLTEKVHSVQQCKDQLDAAALMIEKMRRLLTHNGEDQISQEQAEDDNKATTELTMMGEAGDAANKSPGGNMEGVQQLCQLPSSEISPLGGVVGMSPNQQPRLSVAALDVNASEVVTGTTTIAGDGEYNGDMLDGKPFGRGTAKWQNQGHMYTGEWRNGVMHGKGTAIYLNGDRYDGEWAGGKRCGLGRYVHRSGDVYEGFWVSEKKHGLGVDTFAENRSNSGSFQPESSCKEVNPTYRGQFQATYRGHFKNNKFEGLGSYFTADGSIYQVLYFTLHVTNKHFNQRLSQHSANSVPTLVTVDSRDALPFFQGEWKSGKAHGTGSSTSIHGSELAFVQYTHGKLMSSDMYDPTMHGEQQARAEAQNRAAVAVALLARRIASSLQGITATQGPPEDDTTGAEEQLEALEDSVVCQAILTITGIRCRERGDAVLLVEACEEGAGGAKALVAQGDVVVEVAQRSCSWYKGLPLDAVVQLLKREDGTLLLGLRRAGTADSLAVKHVVLPTRLR